MTAATIRWWTLLVIIVMVVRIHLVPQVRGSNQCCTTGRIEKASLMEHMRYPLHMWEIGPASKFAMRRAVVSAVPMLASS